MVLHRILTSHSHPQVTALRRRILMGHRLHRILMSSPHSKELMGRSNLPTSLLPVMERSNLPTSRQPLVMGRSNLPMEHSNLLMEDNNLPLEDSNLPMEDSNLLMERLRAMARHQMEANRRSLVLLASRTV